MPSGLLISETPHQVIPSLAAKIGLNESLFLQQLHWLLENKNCCAYDGHRWWKHTNSQWCKRFPYFSEKTVKRTVAALKKKNLIVTESLSWKIEKIRGDRTSWYRVNYEEVLRISDEIEQEKTKELMRVSEENTRQAPEKAKNQAFRQNTPKVIDFVGKGQNDPIGNYQKEESEAIPQNGSQEVDINEKGHIDPIGKGQYDPMSSGQKGPMIYKTYKQDLSSSSKPEQAQDSVRLFDFNSVMAWLLVHFSNEYDLTSMDKVFIEASLEEYRDTATHPSKARALCWIENAWNNRMSTERRSLKVSNARDQRNDAATSHLQAQAEDLEKKSQTLRRQNMTTAEKMNDTSWADDGFMSKYF